MKQTMQKLKDFYSNGPITLKVINDDGLFYRMVCYHITGAIYIQSIELILGDNTENGCTGTLIN
jgi:hypothetical protein